MRQAQDIDGEDLADEPRRQRAGRRAEGHETALVHDRHARGEGRDHGQVVQDRDNRDAEPRHELQHFAARARVEMVGRLVQEEDLWLLRDRAGKLRALALPARQRPERAP